MVTNEEVLPVSLHVHDNESILAITRPTPAKGYALASWMGQVYTNSHAPGRTQPPAAYDLYIVSSERMTYDFKVLTAVKKACDHGFTPTSDDAINQQHPKTR